MEQEHFLSKFKGLPETDMVAAAEYFDKKRLPDFQYRFPDQEILFRRIAGHIYRLLDKLIGNESRVFPNYYRDAERPYAELIDFLRVKGLVETARFTDERYNDVPFFYRFIIKGAYPHEITDGKFIDDMNACSSGRDMNTVLSKGVGEFLERYFLTLYHKRNLKYASPQSLQTAGSSFIHPRHLDGFSEEQKSVYPRRRFNETSVFGWEKVIRVATKKKILIPAQLIYWNYKLADEVKEPFIREPNTNGAGGMFTAEGAILSGIYELIQRDAFVFYWLNTISPPQIDLESVPDETLQAIIKKSKRYGFQIHCLNTTFDEAIPSFIAVIIDPSGQGPYFTCGGGCSLDPIESLTRALEEAWSIYISMYSNGRPSFKLPPNYVPFRSALNRDERMSVAANPFYARHYDFFINGPIKKFSDHSFRHPSRFSSPDKELDFIVKHIEKNGPGYEVYAHLVSHPILLKLGYYVARVVIPEMIPLYLHEQNIPLAARRLKTALRKKDASIKRDYNAWPHPFP